MKRGWPKRGWLVCSFALAISACGSTEATTFTAPRIVDLDAERAAAEVVRLEGDRQQLAREEALATLRGVAGLSADDRRAAIARVWRLAPSVIADEPPDVIAGIAPDVLRVYDLGAVLDDGPDRPAVFGGIDQGVADTDGGSMLLRRVAARVIEELPGPEPDVFVEVLGECLVALQPPARFAPLEALLDRYATVGGGHATVWAMETTTSDPALANASDTSITWIDGDLARRLAESRTTSAAITVDIPYGRERGAAQVREASFVQDFYVDAPSGVADPEIGIVRDGLGVSGVLGPAPPGAADPRPRLRLRVGVSDAVRPFPEFSTSLRQEGIPVRIQIPELRLMEVTDDVTAEPRVGVIRLPSETPRTLVVGIEAIESGTAPRRGWRRANAAPHRLPTAPTGPRMENALELASGYLAAGRDPDAADALRRAVKTSQRQRWTRRVRLGPDGTDGVLLRAPFSGDADALRAALGAVDVTAAKGYGFIDVASRELAAAVVPESLGRVRRALGPFQRAASAPPRPRLAVRHVTVTADPHAWKGAWQRDLPPGAAGTPSGRRPLRVGDSFHVSYIEDFDIEVARGAVIAEPYIGSVRNGASVEVRAVPSEPAGTYDVVVDHALIEFPIAQFTTSMSALPEVTLQIPTVQRHRTTRRIRLGPGQSVDLETAVTNGDAHALRRFTFTRVDGAAVGRGPAIGE